MLIILEGMSTVGKTMLQKALAVVLGQKGVRYRLVDQDQGLPPETFEHLDPEQSVKFIIEFLKSLQDKDVVVICDRLHLSHIAITNGSSKHMEMIERELAKYNPLLILLTVDESKAAARIEGAIQHRGEQWIEELARRGEGRADAVRFMVGTQRRLLDLYAASSLSKEMYDTTNMNFQELAEDIADKYVTREA